MKKIIFYLIIFIVVGELLIRFDKAFGILEESHIVKISSNIELTPEFKLLNKESFPIASKDLRIMVIGDSYIHGGGIEFKSNFSQQLKKELQSKKTKFENIWVLDVSKSNSNSLDNNETYFKFEKNFKPNIVILGYNLNDIDGNLNKQDTLSENSEGLDGNKPSGAKSVSSLRKIYDVLYTSEFIHFTLKKTHSFIKTLGIVLPNSRFDITMKSYYQNRNNWKKSKILLKEIINDSRKKDRLLIVYKFPEVNLLEYPQLFSKANSSIKNYFENFPSLIYVNGRKALIDGKSEDYILSKYDGHPNENAHKKMAHQVFEIIESEYDF